MRMSWPVNTRITESVCREVPALQSITRCSRPITGPPPGAWQYDWMPTPRAASYPTNSHSRSHQISVLLCYSYCWVSNLVDSRFGVRDLLISDPVSASRWSQEFRYVRTRKEKKEKKSRQAKHGRRCKKINFPDLQTTEKKSGGSCDMGDVGTYPLSKAPCITIEHGPWLSEVSPLLRLLTAYAEARGFRIDSNPCLPTPHSLYSGCDDHIGMYIRGTQPGWDSVLGNLLEIIYPEQYLLSGCLTREAFSLKFFDDVEKIRYDICTCSSAANRRSYIGLVKDSCAS